MSKIIEIEYALKRINGDNFQEFCNHYLFYKLNPNSIDPIGSVIGKEKSRKGMPDSYFTTKDGELIFAEYTRTGKIPDIVFKVDESGESTETRDVNQELVDEVAWKLMKSGKDVTLKMAEYYMRIRGIKPEDLMR